MNGLWNQILMMLMVILAVIVRLMKILSDLAKKVFIYKEETS